MNPLNSRRNKNEKTKNAMDRNPDYSAVDLSIQLCYTEARISVHSNGPHRQRMPRPSLLQIGGNYEPS